MTLGVPRVWRGLEKDGREATAGPFHHLVFSYCMHRMRAPKPIWSLAIAVGTCAIITVVICLSRRMRKPGWVHGPAPDGHDAKAGQLP